MATIIIIISIFLCHTRKKSVKLPELGVRGGVWVIWAMPELKSFFGFDVFPKRQKEKELKDPKENFIVHLLASLSSRNVATTDFHNAVAMCITTFMSPTMYLYIVYIRHQSK